MSIFLLLFMYNLCCAVLAGAFAQNAFWADHWTYTLDLVHNYLAVYPDQEEVRTV
jgi:hypothetical protein